jgi:hypothetical protein
MQNGLRADQRHGPDTLSTLYNVIATEKVRYYLLYFFKEIIIYGSPHIFSPLN